MKWDANKEPRQPFLITYTCATLIKNKGKKN
jgi:hypothetical protein